MNIKRMKKNLILFSVFSLISGFSFAQARKYSNEFMSIGVGARALGMSNTGVATVNDISSGYWNPAGLLGIESNMQLGLMHSEYFAGIAKYDYGAVGLKVDSSSAVAVSVVRFGVDGIPNTTDLIDAEGRINYDRITSFSVADYGFLVSSARKMNVPGLRVGANAKIIYRQVGDMAKAWGFGLDAGAQYSYKGWQFGLMARDITTTFNAWSFSFSDRMIDVWTQTGNVIPENSVEITLPKIILAAGKKIQFKNNISLLGEINADFSTDGRRNVLISGDPVSIDPHLGLEAGYRNVIFLRGGIGNIQREKSELGDRKLLTFQPNIGLGLRLKLLQLDYAFTDVANQSVALYSHVISLKLDIYKK